MTISRTIIVFIALILALSVAAAPAGAQRAGASTQAGPPAAPQALEVRVFRLSSARAEDIGNAITPVLDHKLERMTSEERTNSLIVSARPETLKTIERLVGMLDVEVDDAGASRAQVVRVFPLEHAVANDQLTIRLGTMFVEGGQPVLRVAHDAASNQLIARGRAAHLDALASVIESIDRAPRAAPGAGGMDVRLVWLVRGLDETMTSPAPRDMQPVLDELGRIGVTGLRMAAQAVVRTSVDEQFDTHFVTELDQPWEMHLVGQTRNAGAASRRLQISIDGVAVDGSASTSLVTTITATSGHFMVLGVSPIHKLDSVFVIQITDR